MRSRPATLVLLELNLSPCELLDWKEAGRGEASIFYDEGVMNGG
jgi:hypothetical protein